MGLTVVRACKLGYTDEELRDLLGETFERFKQWNRGAAIPICDGKDGCGPHGKVTFTTDVDRFGRSSELTK